MNTELQIEKRSRNSQILTDDEVKKLRVHLGSFVSSETRHTLACAIRTLREGARRCILMCVSIHVDAKGIDR